MMSLRLFARNRKLKVQIVGRRLRSWIDTLDGAVWARRLGRVALPGMATLVTLDTIREGQWPLEDRLAQERGDD